MVIRRKNVVKNIFDIIFPPKCRGCGRSGAYLCTCCKNYILGVVKFREIEEEARERLGEETGSGKEGKRIRKKEGECEKSGRSGRVFDKVGYVGDRDGIIGEMIEEYKYFSVKGMAGVIAEIVGQGFCEGFSDRGGGSLSRRVLKGSEKIVLVPMPTSRKHIRERGFDHMDYLVREIERRMKNVERVRLLVREKDTVQVGADEETRRRQAKEAVRVNPEYLGEDGRIVPEFREAEVVIIDDVWTTGASLTEAGKMLRGAGVKRLKGFAITKNRDGKSPQVRRGGF